MDSGQPLKYDGYLLGILRVGDNPIGFGYSCRNINDTTRTGKQNVPGDQSHFCSKVFIQGAPKIVGKP